LCESVGSRFVCIGSASTASLRFQPTKRPQLATQKPKPKPAAQKARPQTSNISKPAGTPPEAVGGIARPPPKNTLADWTADGDDDVNGFYGAEKRQRGGRKKRKKNKEETQIPQNWDDIYDPSRPNSYEEYKHSEEKISEIREWKDRLYAHRMARQSSSLESDDDRSRPQMNSKSYCSLGGRLLMIMVKEQFAPPAMSFAPPTSLNDTPPPPPPPSVEVHNDPTGEDAYARRMRLSQLARPPERPPSPVQQPFEPPPPPPPSYDNTQAPPPPPLRTAAPVPTPAPTISRAPVRYNLPAAPSEIPKSEAELESALQEEADEPEPEPEADAPRSLRPGQKGFAERLMSKYGWTKGSGLGASGSGIVNPLRAQVVKQKKKPDAEGGGFVGPGGMGKIVGGTKKGGKSDGTEAGKFGAMSEVIVLRGMIDGMDLDAELEGTGDGGLMQEIGEECAEKVSPFARRIDSNGSH